MGAGSTRAKPSDFKRDDTWAAQHQPHQSCSHGIRHKTYDGRFLNTRERYVIDTCDGCGAGILVLGGWR